MYIVQPGIKMYLRPIKDSFTNAARVHKRLKYSMQEFLTHRIMGQSNNSAPRYSLVLNKRGGPNSREGGKFSKNLISGGVVL